MKINNIQIFLALLFLSTLFLTGCNEEPDTPITENVFNSNGLKGSYHCRI